jgi:hypothetical protein
MVPGSRGARCLIFDSDSIVRRLWSFPDAWWDLSDEALSELLEGAPGEVPASDTWMSGRAVVHPTIDAASDLAGTTRALMADFLRLRETTQLLRRENSDLLAECRRQRTEMKRSVEVFAATMRARGVTPEQAIVQIKGAVANGLAGTIQWDDPEAATMVRDAVAWGIAAYYAA